MNSLIKKKVLFISPDLSRSGAPVLMLNVAKILQELMGFATDFLFISGGVLEDDFNKLGNVFILNKTPKNLKDKILAKLSNSNKLNLLKIDYNQYGFIFSNTILNGDILSLIKEKFSGAVVSYIHELKVVSEYLTTPESLKKQIENTDYFFAPSSAVKNYLIENCKIEKRNIEVIPSFIPKYNIKSLSKKNTSQFIIGGCGTVELRKGTDIFIQLAKIFSETFPEATVKFIWKGANVHSLDYMFLEEDIKKLNLEKVCMFLPSSASMEDFYNQLDVFVLTSREDPYPLVVLEAANASVPAICFKNSGGAVEFISNNGKVVNYLDIAAMASAIKEYYDDSTKKQLDGKNALIKLETLHQDKALIVNKITDVLQRLKKL